MSIIKHVTLQKIVAHDFRYDPRTVVGYQLSSLYGADDGFFPARVKNINFGGHVQWLDNRGRGAEVLRICGAASPFPVTS